MKQKGKRLLCLTLAAFILLGFLPFGTAPEASAAEAQYEYTAEKTVFDYSKLTCSKYVTKIIRQSYIDASMRYYIENSEKLQTTLKSGNTVVFCFEGGSDHAQTEYKKTRTAAALLVVQLNKAGLPTVVQADTYSTTFPDQPTEAYSNTKYSKPFSSKYVYGAATLVDGIYKYSRTTYYEGHEALRIKPIEKKGSLYSVYYAEKAPDGYIYHTSSGILIHCRNTKNALTKKGGSRWSMGCINIGHELKHADKFCEKCTQNGMVVVDRQLYKTQLTDIFGNKQQSINAVAKITENSESCMSAVSHKHVYDSKTGNCSCGLHQHDYDAKGICKFSSCGNTNYYQDMDALVSEKPGVAYVEEGEYFTVKTAPYSSADELSERRFLVLKQAVKVDKAVIVGELTNHFGNVWYQVTVPGYEGTYYVYSANVTAKFHSFITISDLTYPKNNAVAGDGASTIVEGMVETQYSTLREVTAAVFNVKKISADEKEDLINNRLSADAVYELAETDKKAECTGHFENLNCTKLDLNDLEDNDSLPFRQLAGDNQYLYVVTATDGNGVNKTECHEFYIRKSSKAVSYYTLKLNTDGTVTDVSVKAGSEYTLPERTRRGSIFLGWSDQKNAETAKFTKSISMTKNTTLYAVFENLEAPSVPNLQTATYHIAEGACQTISWGAVSGATGYKVYVYDELGQEVFTQNTSASVASVPFEEAGEYTVCVEAFNDSLEGHSGKSERSVTVIVHGSLTVNFLNYDGSVWSSQTVSYGESAQTPATDPSRTGYTFSGWDSSYLQLYEDTQIKAVFSPIEYKVTFYDADGNEISVQKVTYSGDTPGSAVQPEPPVKENYTFVGWNTDAWQAVTESGIQVYPVYVWANEDVPVSIEISSLQESGDGYWVYYTVTNNGSNPKMGRVIIAGKTEFGKFITQTESGAFYLSAGEGKEYSGSMYVPVERSSMETLAKVEAYVVDSYYTTRPIAEPDTYYIESADGEYSNWMTEEELAAFTESYTSVESAVQYRYRTKSTHTTDSDYYLGWELESTSEEAGDWGNWSSWQDEEITESEDIQVSTREVLVSDEHTEYRYGRYAGYNVKGKQSGTSYAIATSPSKPHYTNNYTGTPVKEYSVWSTTRYSADSTCIKTTLHTDSEKTWKKKDSSGYYYWYRYYVGAAKAANKYWWEESRVVPAEYKTQYQYRTRTAVTKYTFCKWSDWSEWLFAPETADGSKEVETRTMYRVKLETGSKGSTYVRSGVLGDYAAGKQAILCVYKVDSASDYSNQYIEQVTLDENGGYSFEFDTLDVPSVSSGDYTVTLTLEGSTESLALDSIPAPKREYTVTFVDEVTGEAIGEPVKVSEGENVTAPEVPVHNGYVFIGWEYGLTNIRDNMEITARYAPKLYSVVFVDGVNKTVSMVNDIPYGGVVAAPEVEAAEGYTFIGWNVPEGMSIDCVTGHMIVMAEYKNITHTVTYMDISADGNGEPNVLAVQIVNHGEYVSELLEEAEPVEEEESAALMAEADEEDAEEDIDTEDEEPDDEEGTLAETASVSDLLEIPEDMYLEGWSGGTEAPVTGDLVVTPVLKYYEDTQEIKMSVEPGVYFDTQTVTLYMEENDGAVEVFYRLNSGAEEEEWDEVEWQEYDLAAAAEIEITETSVLEIEAYAENKNSCSSTNEFIILSDDVLPPSPTGASAEQADAESVAVTWDPVENADGYIVTRENNSGECSEFMTEDNGYIDSSVESLCRYCYTVKAYQMVEHNGTVLMLESDSGEEAELRFFGDNVPVENVEINEIGTLYEGSAVQLSAVITPDDAMETEVFWSVVPVTGKAFITNQGLLVAESAGVVEVQALAEDGSGASDVRSIVIEAADTADVSITVSSGMLAKGMQQTVEVALSEKSMAQLISFEIEYDPEMLILSSCEIGNGMAGLSPTVNASIPGKIYFVWEGLSAYTSGEPVLLLTFEATPGVASGDTAVSILTDSENFVLCDGNYVSLEAAAVNGVVSIVSYVTGDVNMDGTVNVMDVNMIRRYSVKYLEFSDLQLMLGDVTGDGKVNVYDANMIRRYAAKLIDCFPVDVEG